MRNPQIRPLTTRDIDEQIDKVLRGLDYPEPPLRLEDVRQLLRLDTGFYTSTDAGIFRELFSRAYVGAQQVFARPTLLAETLSKLKLRALWVPDRKRILIDKTVPVIKQRWVEAHEVTHSVLPWHDEALFGDNEQTLAPHCHEQLEGEANYGAGRLLFLGEGFAVRAADYTQNLASVRALASSFGNTITSTLWRYVEQLGRTKPIIGVISRHPGLPRQPHDVPCRYFIRSEAFLQKFPAASEQDMISIIESYCTNQRHGDLGSEEIILNDGNEESHAFAFETFYNGYDALTLGVYLRPVANQYPIAP